MYRPRTFLIMKNSFALLRTLKQQKKINCCDGAREKYPSFKRKLLVKIMEEYRPRGKIKI